MKRNLDDLTDRKQAFVLHWVQSKMADLVTSYLKAGYKDNPKKNQGNAKMLLRELHLYVEDAVHSHIGSHVPFAINGILELAKTSKSDTLRFKAFQDILSRAGYDAPQVIETKETLRESTDKELQDEVDKLIRGNTNVKKINVKK